MNLQVISRLCLQRVADTKRGGQLDTQSLAVQRVGDLIASP